MDLNHARLPIPPYPHILFCNENYFTINTYESQELFENISKCRGVLFLRGFAVILKTERAKEAVE